MSSVLLADDNPHARRMGRQVLVEEGYQVLVASNGNEALDSARTHRPDLAILGTRMEGLSGFELCRRMKTDPELGQVCVVLLAGPREEVENETESFAACDGVLRKPLDPESVIRTVRDLLNGAAGAPNTATRREDEGDDTAAAEVEPATDPGGESEAPQTPDPRPEAETFEAAAGAKEGVIVGEGAGEEDAQAVPVVGHGVEVRAEAADSDPFADLVQSALAAIPAADPAEVRRAVTAAVESAVPEIVDRVTERILQAMRKP